MRSGQDKGRFSCQKGVPKLNFHREGEAVASICPLNPPLQSDEECKQIYNVARKIMLDGAFNLRKWRTNSKSLQREIDAKESTISPQSDSNEVYQEVEESYAKATVGNKPESNSQEQIVLGLLWNYEEDDLILCYTVVLYFPIIFSYPKDLTMHACSQTTCRMKSDISSLSNHVIVIGLKHRRVFCVSFN